MLLSKVTMRDVAKLAGVSQSTVSRALSTKPSAIPISEETYAKIQQAVETLGYYPNLTASSLRSQKSHLIAVMIADISNAFYHSIARTIQDIAVHHNYDVMLSNTDHLYEYEKRFCETIMRRPVDGIVLVPYHLTNDDIRVLLERTGAAISVLGRHIQQDHIDVVSADDEAATYEAVQWLINVKGHQHIGLIGASPNFSVSIRRQRGYEQALKAAQLPINPAWVQIGDFTPESGYQAMQNLIQQPVSPSAVFACNDMMAIGALNAALDAGLRVPEDVAIIGFDNIPAATLVRPTLTTVAQYPVEIGRHLAEAMFQRIAGTYTGPARHFNVACQLIERQST